MVSNPRPGVSVLTVLRQVMTRPGTLRTFGLVMVLAGGAKLAGLAKEVVVAAEFGTGPSIDAYIFLFNILSTPISIWFGAIFATLVPYLIQLESRNPRSAARFEAEFATLSIGFGTISGALFAIGLYAFISMGASGLSEAAVQFALTILPWVWIFVPFMFVAQYGASCLMARNLHANSLYDGAPALVILIAVLVLPPTITTLGIATVAGAGLQMVATFGSLFRANKSVRFALPRRSSAWRGFWPGFGIMAGVQTLQSASPIIDQLIAAQLPAGSLAQFNYALKIQALALTLIALAIPRVLLPALASLRDAGRLEVDRFVRRWSLLLGLASVTIATIVTFLARDIVHVIYERGAFNPEDTTTIASLMKVMIWQLPFYTLSILYSQVHFSKGNYAIMAAVAIGAVLVKLSIGLALVWQFGLLGLAASGTVTYAFQVAALVVVSKIHAKGEVR